MELIHCSPEFLDPHGRYWTKVNSGRSLTLIIKSNLIVYRTKNNRNVTEGKKDYTRVRNLKFHSEGNNQILQESIQKFKIVHKNPTNHRDLVELRDESRKSVRIEKSQLNSPATRSVARNHHKLLVN